MSFWKDKIRPEQLNEIQKNTLSDFLGIVFTEVGDDFLEATMPVVSKTHQPMGLLHGGASMVLAETLGSVASNLCLESGVGVGLEINGNHLKSVRSGIVRGVCKPVKIGRSIHVWSIKIFNEADELVCLSRLTVAVLNKAGF